MRILLVTSRFPLPPWRGNQLRTIQWLDAIADHERLLICPAETGDDLPPELGVEMCRLPRGGYAATAGLVAAVAGGRPAQEGLYDSAAARRLVTETLHDWQPDVAVIQMVRSGWAADAIRGVDPELPMIFDAIDCMALHYRRAMASVGPLMRPAYRFEAERCRRREAELVTGATFTTAVSGRDLRALGAETRGMVVTVTGGMEVTRTDPPTGEPIIVLSGNLGYRPTVRAALWFAERVWPKLLDRAPSARWILVGARPAAAVRRLASRPGIEVYGDVDDIKPYLGRSRVAIAPMASGSGVPVKILEAMAAGVPVVAEHWSADGLEDPSAVAVADGEAAWVDVLLRLLSEPELAHEQAARGTEAWRTHYAPSRVRSRIREVVSVAAARAR